MMRFRELDVVRVEQPQRLCRYSKRLDIHIEGLGHRQHQARNDEEETYISLGFTNFYVARLQLVGSSSSSSSSSSLEAWNLMSDPHSAADAETAHRIVIPITSLLSANAGVGEATSGTSLVVNIDLFQPSPQWKDLPWTIRNVTAHEIAPQQST